jgi:predicted CoA-binding protein
MDEQMFEQDVVDEFLAAEVYAVVGVSTNKEKYGYKVFQDLREGDYTVYPVNPLCEDIYGEKCYQDLSSLPEKPDVVEFVCPPDVTDAVVRKLPSMGIDKAWMQPGAESPQAIEFCKQHGIKVLHDICIMVERRKNTG